MELLPFIPHQFLWHLSISSIFILTVISAIINSQSKEESFKYYVIYGSFIFIYLFLKAPYELPFRDSILQSRFSGINWYIQVVYNCAYFIFFLHFLNLKVHLYTFYKTIRKVVIGLLSVSTLVFVVTVLLNTADYFKIYFIYAFAPLTTAFAIFTIIRVLGIPGKLKYFVAIGGGIYILFALFALYVTLTGNYKFGFHSMFYFYIGVFVEHLVFANGLAYKVKVINQNMLHQYRENEKIKKEQSALLQKELKQREEEIFKLTETAENIRIKTLETKYKEEVNHLHLTSLRNQMNPHFIFNALNSIKVFLIDNNKTQAIYYLNKFSKLIRVILESSRVNSVALSHEIETVKLYFGIEKMRFNDNVELRVYIDGDINLSLLKVPPLILQPFVENSLWHGLMLSKGEKKISIRIYSEDGVPKLSLKDNGVGRVLAKAHRDKKTYKKESIGLQITKERIEYFNESENHNYGYTIVDLYDSNNEPSGTEVLFTFE